MKFSTKVINSVKYHSICMCTLKSFIRTMDITNKMGFGMKVQINRIRTFLLNFLHQLKIEPAAEQLKVCRSSCSRILGWKLKIDS